MNNKFRPPESYLEGTEQTFVIVDYSNLLYRAWFVSRKRAWVAYCKFFDMLRLCIKRSKQKDVPLKIIFAGESKTKLDRTKIFKDYKANRGGSLDDPKFTKFRAELPELLKFIGWDIISVDGAEADDVIATLVADLQAIDAPSTSDIVIFSGDRDMQQCLAWARVLIYRAPGLFVTRSSFEEEYGVPIGKFNVYKALVGDKSDNIKCVEGFGPAKAAKAVSSNSVAEDIW
jgi:5'-3' exonuclease